MKIIVAVDKNWGIGCDNDLLFNLPLDMKHFKETTTGGTVIMGRKTLESLPNGQPLKNRDNIVLSRQDIKGDFKLVNNTDELLKEIKGKDNVFIIGGASVYEMLLPYCDEAIITKVDSAAKADCFFPNLDKHENFGLSSETDWIEDSGHKIKFCIYKKKN
ncbi:MAG: dihydrofolate reductase [Firmicutes bacterium]|nr:dihydrofolate reductase [Bacillota bacterium]